MRDGESDVCAFTDMSGSWFGYVHCMHFMQRSGVR